MNNTPLYRGTAEQARKEDKLQLWRDSFQANILCRIAIENEIRRHFDGMHLDKGCAGRVLDEFGQERVKYVLSATLQELDYDGRFSRSNKEWGRQTEIIPSTRNYEFAVQSHPAVLDGFISDFRSECQQRQMDHSVMQMSISM